MKVAAWCLVWFFGIQLVASHTHSPGMFLAGMVIMTGLLSLVQLSFVLLGWVGR